MLRLSMGGGRSIYNGYEILKQKSLLTYPQSKYATSVLTSLSLITTETMNQDLVKPCLTEHTDTSVWTLVLSTVT